MRSKCFCAVIFVFLLLFAGSAVASSIRHDGFMGIKWGTNITRFPGIDWDHLDYEWKLHVEVPIDRLKNLTRAHETITKFDGFPVYTVVYNFLDIRFSSVNICFAKDAWIEDEAYIDYLLDNLGKPANFDELKNTLFWQFDDGFVVIANCAPHIPNVLMILTLMSPQEAKYHRYAK